MTTISIYESLTRWMLKRAWYSPHSVIHPVITEHLKNLKNSAVFLGSMVPDFLLPLWLFFSPKVSHASVLRFPVFPCWILRSTVDDLLAHADTRLLWWGYNAVHCLSLVWRMLSLLQSWTQDQIDCYETTNYKESLTFDVQFYFIGVHVLLLGGYLALVDALVTRLHVLDDEAPLVRPLVVVNTDPSVAHKGEKSYRHRMWLCGLSPSDLKWQNEENKFREVRKETPFSETGVSFVKNANPQEADLIPFKFWNCAKEKGDSVQDDWEWKALKCEAFWNRHEQMCLFYFIFWQGEHGVTGYSSFSCFPLYLRWKRWK